MKSWLEEGRASRSRQVGRKQGRRDVVGQKVRLMRVAWSGRRVGKQSAKGLVFWGTVGSYGATGLMQVAGMRDFRRDARRAWGHTEIVIARARLVCGREALQAGLTWENDRPTAIGSGCWAWLLGSAAWLGSWALAIVGIG